MTSASSLNALTVIPHLYGAARVVVGQRDHTHVANVDLRDHKDDPSTVHYKDTSHYH